MFIFTSYLKSSKKLLNILLNSTLLLNYILATDLDLITPKPKNFEDSSHTKDGFLKKDINYYLEKNDALLWSYYNQVIKQSKKQNYPIYSRRYIIDAKSYSELSSNAKQMLRGQIVFASIIIDTTSNKTLNYSELGGISIKGILAQDAEEKNAKKYFFKFDSRYYSDLEALDKKRRIYAYCILPSFSSCILIGIHEEW